MFYFGTAHYVLTLALIPISLLLTWYLFKGKEAKVQKRFLLILAFINFALHFLKILIPPYSSLIFVDADNTFPYSLASLGASNFCALNTLLLPFALLSKKQGFRDSVLILAFVGGLMAVVYPVDHFDQTLFVIDIFRYYICHLSLMLVPILSLIFGTFSLSYKSWWKVPGFVLLEMCVIFFNAAFLSEIGLLPLRSYIEVSDYGNEAFVYGPYFHRHGEILPYLDIFVPEFLKRVPKGFLYYDNLRGFYDNADKLHYWPIIWAIGPIVIYGFPLSFLLFFALDHKNFKKAIKKRLGK
ncbi:MAG: hypothetical protein ACOX0I_02935 [Bacilli bacterium]|jgi:hypothetical protein